MKNWIKKIVGVVVLVTGGLSGCTYYLPHQLASSNVPLDPPAYEVVGPASGQACRNLLFYTIPVGGTNRLQAAIDNALEKSRGDALIEVTTDYKVFLFYPFFAKHCTLVNGVAIKRKQTNR